MPSDVYGTTPQQGSSQAEAPEACKDVEMYKDKAPEDNHDTFQIWWNTFRCDAWAEDHSNQKLLHDSFSALNHLYTEQLSALEEDLWPNKNAPAVCKVFQDYQKTSHDVIMSGVSGGQSKTETVEKAMRAEKDFRAQVIKDPKGSVEAIDNLSACFHWALGSHQTVIALKTRQLASELEEESDWKAYSDLAVKYKELLDLAKRQDAALSQRPAVIEHVVVEHVTEPRFQLPPPPIHCSGYAFQTGSLTQSTVNCY